VKVMICLISHKSSRIQNLEETASPAQTDNPGKTRGVISLRRLELLRDCVTSPGQRSVATSLRKQPSQIESKGNCPPASVSS